MYWGVDCFGLGVWGVTGRYVWNLEFHILITTYQLTQLCWNMDLWIVSVCRRYYIGNVMKMVR